MFRSRNLAASLVLALLASACNSIGERAEGVLPAEPVAPPPFMRPGARAEVAAPRAPARPEQLSRPARLNGPERVSRPDAPSTRRIRREDLEPEEPSARGSQIGPAITPGGGIGLGGRF